MNEPKIVRPLLTYVLSCHVTVIRKDDGHWNEYGRRVHTGWVYENTFCLTVMLTMNDISNLLQWWVRTVTHHLHDDLCIPHRSRRMCLEYVYLDTAYASNIVRGGS